MPTLYDNDTGASLGSISDEQIRALSANLEEESTEDQDYYLNADTIDMLEAQGADAALVAMLRQGLGDKDGIEVRWS